MNDAFRGHSWTFAAGKNFTWASEDDPLSANHQAQVSGDDRLLVAGRRFHTWGLHMDAAQPDTPVFDVFDELCPLLPRHESQPRTGITFHHKTGRHYDGRATRQSCGGFGDEEVDFKSRIRDWADSMFSLQRDVLLEYGDYEHLEVNF